MIKKQAMITIEILISMFILFLVITTSLMSTKFFNFTINQKANYEIKYITILSLKDKILNESCLNQEKQEGIFNNNKFEVQCIKLKELRSYYKDFEDNKTGNIGNINAMLYKINLIILNETYTFYHTFTKEIK